jgi:hypothetical protein
VALWLVNRFTGRPVNRAFAAGRRARQGDWSPSPARPVPPVPPVVPVAPVRTEATVQDED